MWILKARKKGSSVIEKIELNDRVVPWLKIITASRDGDIDLVPHKHEIMDYFNTTELPGAAQVRMVLKRYEKVRLVQF